MRFVELGVALLAVVSGCATAMYPGPRRPKEATAIITLGRGREIEAIDGRVVRGGEYGAFTVLPGPHVLKVSAHDSVAGFFVTTHYYGPPSEICLEADAGHVYSINGRIIENQWALDVFDDGLLMAKSELVCEAGPDQPPLLLAGTSKLNERDEWKPPLPGNGFLIGSGDRKSVV